MAIEAEVSSAYLVNRTLLHMQSQFCHAVLNYQHWVRDRDCFISRDPLALT